VQRCIFGHSLCANFSVGVHFVEVADLDSRSVLNVCISDAVLPAIIYVQVFTTRCVCIAQIMLWQDVCPSVCPSVTCPYSVDTAEHILQIFLPPNSLTILVFSYQTGWQYSDGAPLRGHRMQGHMEKIAIFDQYLALSQ